MAFDAAGKLPGGNPDVSVYHCGLAKEYGLPLSLPSRTRVGNHRGVKIGSFGKVDSVN
jgi:hypothetical protein